MGGQARVASAQRQGRRPFQAAEVGKADHGAWRPAKLAFVAQPTNVVPPLNGWALSIQLYETARRLAKSYEVTIFSRKHPDLPDEEIREGVRYVRVDTHIDWLIAYYLERVSDLFQKFFQIPIRSFSSHYAFQWFYYLLYICKVGLAIRAERFDIIQTPNFSQFVPILRFLNPKARIVFLIQCEWLVQIRPRLARRRMNGMEAILGCSRYITEGIRQSFPKYRDRCRILYNAVDVNQFCPGPPSAAIERRYGLTEGKTILFVGRLTPEKGVHVLLDAMAIVVDLCPGAVLMIVGAFSNNPPTPAGSRSSDGDAFEVLKRNYPRALRERAAALGEHVRFVGPVSRQDLPEYYRTADLLVHPSLWEEPFGMILVEAMACGRAVISTAKGGIPEIVDDGQCGRLVDAGDHEALAAAIIDLLMSPKSRAQMGRRGRMIVERRFNWDSVAAELDAVYQDLLGARLNTRKRN